MLRRYGSGKLSRAQIFQPAIELAEGGSALTKFGARHFPGPGPYAGAEQCGDLLYQPELAQTYRELAEGGDERFYRGDIAAKIVGFMEAGGGLITSADLAACDEPPDQCRLSLGPESPVIYAYVEVCAGF